MFTTFHLATGLSSRKPRRFAGVSGAAYALGALLSFAAPHQAWAGEGNPQQNLFLQSTPAPTPTNDCPPAKAKKVAALKDKIGHDKDRIDGLKEKIANRKQQMEKIQPGSSQQSFANFAPNSRLYNLALDNMENEKKIEDLTIEVNAYSSTLPGCPE